MYNIPNVSEIDHTNKKQVKSILKSSFKSIDWQSHDSVLIEKKDKS